MFVETLFIGSPWMENGTYCTILNANTLTLNVQYIKTVHFFVQILSVVILIACGIDMIFYSRPVREFLKINLKGGSNYGTQL
jgi:hypothetical protein